MPPRKSARTSKKTAKAAEDADWNPDEADAAEGAVEVDENFEAPAKKAKGKSKATPTAKGKGKGGRKKKLEVFNTMPIDVLALIMTNLDTKTLLAMSRTCSTFRRVLHSEHGNSIWKAGRRNTHNIPDLEAGDLKEWEYASLLFDSSCHICHKDRAKTTDYTLRVRCCADCMRSNSKRKEKILSAHRFHPKVWECVPESTWSPGWGGEVYHFFWVPTVTQVSARLKELEGKPEYNDYLKEREKIHKFAAKDGRQISLWELRFRMHKEDDKEDVKRSRRNKIKEKLTELGYTTQELASYEFTNHKEVNQARDLTDTIWKRIKPILTALVDNERAEKARLAALQAMKSRALALKPWYEALQTSIPAGDARSLFPPWANFLVLPSARALYEKVDVAPSQDELNAKRATVLEEGRRFGAEIKIAFFAKLAQAHTEAANASSASSGQNARYASAPVVSGSSVEELARLVTSAVPCPTTWCQTTATFPTILDHFKVCGSAALTETSLTTSANRILATRCVLAAINAVEEGKVSETKTTTTDLHALGKAFKCQDCVAAVAAVGAANCSAAYNPDMTWSQMVWHLLNNHVNPSTGFLPPELVFTPPEPLAPGPENPGGFLVEGEEEEQ